MGRGRLRTSGFSGKIGLVTALATVAVAVMPAASLAHRSTNHANAAEVAPGSELLFASPMPGSRSSRGQSDPAAHSAAGPTYQIPAPPKPPTTLGQAALKAAGETLQTVGAAAIGLGGAALTASLVASATGVAAPVGVPSAGVSALIIAGGVALHFIGGWIKNYNSDPIRFDFHKIANPPTVHLPTIRPAAPVLAKSMTDVHNLLQTSVEGFVLSQAFQTSVDRAHGAMKRHDAFWRQRQVAAALGFAHEGAVLINKVLSLQSRLQTDVRHVGISGSISRSDVSHDEHVLETHIPTALVKELKHLGLGRYAGSIESSLRSAATGTSFAIGFPSVLTDPVLRAEETATAKTLARYNAASILAIIARSHG